MTRKVSNGNYMSNILQHSSAIYANSNYNNIPVLLEKISPCAYSSVYIQD